jgi:hypothetical protein
MTKFEILSKLHLVRNNYPNSISSSRVKWTENFLFDYYRHDTGECLNIYLVDGEKSLHIYYDYHWFNPRYEFNEYGKKHGHLIDDAPWVPVLEAKFAQFEKEILEVEEKQRLAGLKQRQEKEDKDKELVEYFKGKF